MSFRQKKQNKIQQRIPSATALAAVPDGILDITVLIFLYMFESLTDDRPYMFICQ